MSILFDNLILFADFKKICRKNLYFPQVYVFLYKTILDLITPAYRNIAHEEITLIFIVDKCDSSWPIIMFIADRYHFEKLKLETVISHYPKCYIKKIF